MSDKKFDASALYFCAFIVLHFLITLLCLTQIGITINRRIAYLVTGYPWKVTSVYIVYLCLTSFFSFYLIHNIVVLAKSRSDKIMFGISLSGITITHCMFIILFLIFANNH